jgi:hypothetical protein
MTPEQKTAFYDGSGLHASGMIFDIRMLVGGVALICCLIILVGLMHYINSNSGWDKSVFLLSIFMLCFILMVIFIYIA